MQASTGVRQKQLYKKQPKRQMVEFPAQPTENTGIFPPRF